MKIIGSLVVIPTPTGIFIGAKFGRKGKIQPFSHTESLSLQNIKKTYLTLKQNTYYNFFKVFSLKECAHLLKTSNFGQ